ncbi:MAG: glycosyltransferase [Terracidiphilus sp.]|jgi:GT2 family glycosyltransferase
MQEASALTLSVVIPTRNRPRELSLCLDALRQAAVTCMEVIVIDDGSEMDLSEIVAAARLNAKLLCNLSSVGSAVARNTGAAVARGDILLFVDDDVCVSPRSVRSLLGAFEGDSGLGAVIGRYDDEPASPEFLSQFRNLLHAYTHRISAGDASTFWTGFGAVRSSIFRRHGGFSVRSRAIDDVEFGAQISNAGVRIELRPDLLVKHLKPWTLKSMLKTDLLLRGIPWTLLLWRNRKLPNTLNLRYSNRLSVALSCAAVLLGVAGMAAHFLWALFALALIALSVLNFKFYLFLGGRRGTWFALCSVPAHWLHLCTAGLSFTLGTAMYFADKLKAVAARTPGHILSATPRIAGSVSAHLYSPRRSEVKD